MLHLYFQNITIIFLKKIKKNVVISQLIPKVLHLIKKNNNNQSI